MKKINETNYYAPGCLKQYTEFAAKIVYLYQMYYPHSRNTIGPVLWITTKTIFLSYSATGKPLTP